MANTEKTFISREVVGAVMARLEAIECVLRPQNPIYPVVAKALSVLRREMGAVGRTGLALQDKEDGFWLRFTSKNGRDCAINIGMHFNKDTIIDSTVRDWAKEQFEETDNDN